MALALAGFSLCIALPAAFAAWPFPDYIEVEVTPSDDECEAVQLLTGAWGLQEYTWCSDKCSIQLVPGDMEIEVCMVRMNCISYPAEKMFASIRFSALEATEAGEVNISYKLCSDQNPVGPTCHEESSMDAFVASECRDLNNPVYTHQRFEVCYLNAVYPTTTQTSTTLTETTTTATSTTVTRDAHATQCSPLPQENVSTLINEFRFQPRFCT